MNSDSSIRGLKHHEVHLFIVPLFFVFLWSTGFIGAKYTVAYSEPFFLLFLRGILSCSVFAALALVMRAEWPDRNTAIKQMITGLMLQVMFLGGCFKAIYLGMPAAYVSIITGMQPIMTALFVTLVHRQSFRPVQWIGISIGFLGIFFVLNPTSNQHYTLDVTAITASIIGLIGITIGSLYQKRFKGNGHLVTQVFFQYVSLTIAMGSLTLLFEKQQVQWSINFALGLGWLVIVVSVTAVLLLMFMIKHGESTKVATYFYLVPVFTAFESWLIFNETISILGLIGIACSITGMIMVIRHSKPV